MCVVEDLSRLGDVIVDGLYWPTDMVADPIMSCVYITDRYGIKEKQSDPDSPGLFAIMDSRKPSDVDVALDGLDVVPNGLPDHPVDGISLLPLQVTPAGLSLNSQNHLLVVCEHEKRGRSLRFFRAQRSGSGAVRLVELEERRISLHVERFVLQAVEVNRETFVISQVHKGSDVHRILVVDSGGNQVRSKTL